MFDTVKKLCEIPGISGREHDVAQAIAGMAREHTDDIFIDALGNVIAKKRGAVVPKMPIMLAAHMDEVGFMVNYITEDGLLRVVNVGGVYGQTLSGRTLFLPRSGLFGMLGKAPIHLRKDADDARVPNVDELYLDIGAMSREEAKTKVQLGDTAVFDTKTRDFGDDMLLGKALDDRLGCAILLELMKKELPCDVCFAFTVQEEVGLRGAATAAFAVRPGAAIIVDVAGGADNAGFKEQDKICMLNKGPVISFADRATIYDAELFELATRTADESKIPWQSKTRLSGGTDAGAVHKSAEGVRVIGISVTGRNIHTAASCVSKEDARQATKLIEKILERLNDVL